MPIVYSRDVPKNAPAKYIEATTQHVIDHCHSVAAEDDDPANDDHPVSIDISERVRDDGVTVLHIVGTLDADPVAPYLRPDFDPDEDERTNPLSDEYLERRAADERRES